MARFIDAYRRQSPIAAAIRNFGNSMFGDTLSPALRREQLRDAARKNDAIDALTAQLGPVAGQALAAGQDPGKINLFATAINPEYDPLGMEVGRAQLASGMATSSTTPGFLADQTRQVATDTANRSSREGIAAADRHSREGIAANALAQTQAQYLHGFNNDFVPIVDPSTGNPTFTTKGDFLAAVKERNENGTGPVPTPVLSYSDVRGGMLTHMDSTGELTPEQRVQVVGGTVADKAPAELSTWTDGRGNYLKSSDGGRTIHGSEGTPMPPEFALQPSKVDPNQRPERPAEITSWSNGKQIIKSTDGGLTDMYTGAEIPPEYNIKIGSVGAGVTDPSTLTTANTTNLNDRAVAFREFQGSIQPFRQMVQELGPGGFGPAGAAQRLGQTVEQAAIGLDALFGGNLTQTVNSAVAQAGGIDPNDPVVPAMLFDPNLSNVDRMANMMAFQAAATIAGQTGRGLSDKDFRTFRNIVGDPTAFFGSQASMLAGIDLLERQVAMMLGINQQARQGVLDGPAPQGAPPPDTAQTPQRMRYNAATGQLEPVQ